MNPFTRPKATFKQAFYDHIQSHRDPYFVTRAIENEIRQISIQMFQLWHKVIDLLCLAPHEICKNLRNKYNIKLEQQAKKYIIH